MGVSCACWDDASPNDLSLLQSEHDHGAVVGLNLVTGEPMDPQTEGVFDNYNVKKQIINSA